MENKDNTLKIRCRNNGEVISIPLGSTLHEAYEAAGIHMEYGPLVARVNNKVKGMDYRFYNNKDVEFLSLKDAAGMRAYVRTLFLVLIKAVEDVFPQATLSIKAPVNGGYYCELRQENPATEADIQRLRNRMQQIVDEDMPILHVQSPVEEATKLFEQRNMQSRVKLLESIENLYTEFYQLGDTIGSLGSAMLTHTGMLHRFDLIPFMEGMLLCVPGQKDPDKLQPNTNQSKLIDVIREHHRWQGILGIQNVGDFNKAVLNGKATELINVSEALQDKKLNHIADEITRRHSRMVLIAGPSSSGKTTTSKRLAILLMACGLRPYTISTDDYFVNRVDTPLDENGEYDFECIQAVDTDFFNLQMNELLEGKEVELPRYDFQTGRRVFEGKKLQIGPDDVIILEGNHALNPILTQQIPDDEKFRIYVSALTTIQLDDHNCIPSQDIRLMRRIVRDYRYRGFSALQTIRRCPSVTAGEEKWITPFQVYADVIFNSALLYEISVIKEQVITILEKVSEREIEYAEANRLRKFLRYFRSIPGDQVPPTSLLREFAGGSSFKY